MVLKNIQEFFRNQFPEYDEQQSLSESEILAIQNQLLSFWEMTSTSEKPLMNLFNSEVGKCFRCYISHIILKVGISLVRRYGKKAKEPFTLDELLVCILTDDGHPLKHFQENTLFFHSSQILEAYLKHKEILTISLAALAFNLTKHSAVVKQFMLEHGIVLSSDWGILNKTTPTKLKNILCSDFYKSFFCQIEESEIHRKFCILKSYHLVYRKDRRGQFGRCKPPTTKQLQRMVDDLSQEYSLTITIQELLDENNSNQGELKTIAEIKRKHLIWEPNPILIEGGLSLDNQSNTGQNLHEKIASTSDSPEEQRIGQLWSLLKPRLESYLDEAIAQEFPNLNNFLNSWTADLEPYLFCIFQRLCCEFANQQQAAANLPIDQSRISRQVFPLYTKLFGNVKRKVKQKFLEYMIQQAMQIQRVETPKNLENFDEILTSVDELFERTFPPSEANLGDARTREERMENSLYFQRLCNYLNQL